MDVLKCSPGFSLQSRLRNERKRPIFGQGQRTRERVKGGNIGRNKSVVRNPGWVAVIFFLQMACRHSTISSLAPRLLLWTGSQAKSGSTSFKPMRFDGTMAQWGMMGVLGRVWKSQAGKRQACNRILSPYCQCQPKHYLFSTNPSFHFVALTIVWLGLNDTTIKFLWPPRELALHKLQVKEKFVFTLIVKDPSWAWGWLV